MSQLNNMQNIKKYVFSIFNFLALYLFTVGVFAKNFSEFEIDRAYERLQLALPNAVHAREVNGFIWTVTSVPSKPSFIPLDGESDSFENILGKVVITKILHSKSILNHKEQSYIDLLGTYLVDDSDNDGVAKISECHVCQVLIGVVTYRSEKNVKSIEHQNLFITLEGGWGKAPEIFLSNVRAINHFELNIRHSTLNMGQLFKYQYTLLFKEGSWIEISRHTEISRLDGPDDE